MKSSANFNFKYKCFAFSGEPFEARMYCERMNHLFTSKMEENEHETKEINKDEIEFIRLMLKELHKIPDIWTIDN